MPKLDFLKENHYTINSIKYCEVKSMIISANEVKVKGIGFIEKKLKEDKEIYISVRGKKKFVILDIEDYEKLKEAELDKILREAEEDYKAGRFVKESADEHFKRLKV